MAQLASAPALGAGGRRFESFCPDKMKIRELQRFATPLFFRKNQNLHSICTQTFKNEYKNNLLFVLKIGLFGN